MLAGVCVKTSTQIIVTYMNQNTTTRSVRNIRLVINLKVKINIIIGHDELRYLIQHIGCPLCIARKMKASGNTIKRG